MNNPTLPPKPVLAMPRLQDAKNAHKCQTKTQVKQSLYNNGAENDKQSQQPQLSTVAPQQPRLQLKRKASDQDDSESSQPQNKRVKVHPWPSSRSLAQAGFTLDAPESLSTASKDFLVSNDTPVNGMTFCTDPLTIMTPPSLRWDKAKNAFVICDTTNLISTSTQATKPSEIHGVSNLKRKRPEQGQITSGDIERECKHLRVDVDTEKCEADEILTACVGLNKLKRTRKHPQHRKKAQNVTSLHMRLEDLIPHYIPKSLNFVQSRAKETKTLKALPRNFLGLPTEVRQNIWDKVFEDEAYKFTIKKDSKHGQVSDMIPTPPPSFSCLFIHTTLAGEVAEQMYKSMRVEINFGRLRPGATRDFMKLMANSRLGREAHRIFFNKALSLHKVNMGVFPKAREIVSTNWTVYGDRKMDEEDYLNNHIDPQHVLRAPPSVPVKQKGLKERRFWKDQEAASQRYKRHIEGWCHPQAEDPNQTVQVLDPKDPNSMIEVPLNVHKRPCPFQDKCLNLKDTKFCMVVKYKFGCIKGRHSRHKEVFYDFYPETNRIEQPKPPKSKFYNKTIK